MIVIAAIFIGILTAAIGANAAGFLAIRAVEWYDISGREGKDLYLIVTIGLIGTVFGFVVGLICALNIHADSWPRYFEAITLPLALVLIPITTAGIIARLYADVPPRLRGQPMFLIAEAKWPSASTTSPAQEPGDAFLLLGSLKGHTLRKSERGQLWKHDAKRVDGHWILRGAVNVFTSRGKRLLDINLGTGPSTGLLIPLPAFPGKKDEAWSDWMPRQFPPGTPEADRITYRFRVQRRYEPMHTETFGNFEIVSFIYYFRDAWENGKPHIVNSGSFDISYRGKKLDFGMSSTNQPIVQYLIKLPETTQVLLAMVRHPSYPNILFLLRDLGSDLELDTIVKPGNGNPTLIPLAPIEPVATDRLSENRRQIGSDGLYFVGLNTIFDTRTLKVHRYGPIENTNIGDFRPLMLSPDERSFVRFTFARDTQAPMLTATDFVAGHSYSLPIDRQRMRYVKIEQIDRAWAEHHFKWERDAAGVDQLVARTEFSPLPFRGELGPDGDKHSAYYLYGSNEAISSVLEGVLIDKFAAQRQPPVEYQVDQRFRVGSASVKVFASSDIASVSTEDSTLMNQIAEALNAELATYKHDALFPIK